MKIYIDIIIFINFFFDFFLLLAVSILLKRKVKLYKLLLGSLIGSISILSLFYSFNNLSLFIFKILISIFMVLITFSFKSIKYTFDNIVYLYLVSIILGGFLYFINNSFSYKNVGLIFINNNFSINIILIILLVPIILFIYIKSIIKQKDITSYIYNVEIILNNDFKLSLTGFLDTGNNLYDPYKKRPILVLNSSLIKDYNANYILVPCITVNKHELLKCIKPKEIYINNIKIKNNYLIGISDNNFNLDNVDLLLHKKIIEEIKI